MNGIVTAGPITMDPSLAMLGTRVPETLETWNPVRKATWDLPIVMLQSKFWQHLFPSYRVQAVIAQ